MTSGGGTGHGSIVARIVPAGIAYPTRFRCVAAVDATKSYVIPGQPSGLMAGGASSPIVGDPPPRVSERRSSPVRCGVTGRARTGSRESSPGVIRNGSAQCRGAIPIGSVTAVAIGWRHSRAGMAKIAGHRDVSAGQRETGGVVIKGSAEPGSRRVA